MKKKRGGVEGPPVLKTKLLTSPPSMTEIRAPMVPTLKKTSRKDIELDQYPNPFTNKLATDDHDEEDPS